MTGTLNVMTVLLATTEIVSGCHLYSHMAMVSVRFLWERMGTAFPYLFWPWERRSHTIDHSVQMPQNKEISVSKIQSKKLRYTDTADMRYGHMMSVFL